MMPFVELSELFSDDLMKRLMPPEKTAQFFEALFGDADEGAYEICLKYKGGTAQKLKFEFQLTPKPGKCLACNLTAGLPDVFSHHPVIDAKGLAVKIARQLGSRVKADRWHCGATIERTPDLHAIPFSLEITPSAP
jgi:hypothetical protein